MLLVVPKHVRRCLPSLVIGEIQIKITMRYLYHFTLARMVMIVLIWKISVGKDVEILELSHITSEARK
jgi:hypothetical protein